MWLSQAMCTTVSRDGQVQGQIYLALCAAQSEGGRRLTVCDGRDGKNNR